MKKIKHFSFLLFTTLFLFSCDKVPQPGIENYDADTLIPHIIITIENDKMVTSKDTYLSADIEIKGFGLYDDFMGHTKIKGRGNSSWEFPKKPYRLKLDNAASLLGLPAYKNWILLAEYLDGSMLYNSIPYKMAQMLEIPFTNTIIPVQLTINGKFQGVYAFTEHKEVGPNRIDIGENGQLLELEVYFDEDWKFKSDNYELPVMVQYPEDNMNNQKLQEIKQQFQQFENLVYDASFPNNNYLDYFDDEAFVNYMLVYELTQNRELVHPKSTYINKKEGGKYKMGIIWDFDWAFGYGYGSQHYDLYSVNKPLFDAGDTKEGSLFFGRLMSDPHIRQLFKNKWMWFRSAKFEELKDNVEAYANKIRKSFPADHSLWGERDSSGDIDTDLERVLNWLDARAVYLDDMVAGF